MEHHAHCIKVGTVCVCPNCNQTFIKLRSSSQRFCNECAEKKVRNRATYERLKQDPLRLAAKKLQDKLNARRKINDLDKCYVDIILFTNFIPVNPTMQWYKRFYEVDKEFMRLKRKKTGHREGSEYEFTKEEFAKMLTDANIKNLSDLETWIKETWDKHPN